MCDLSTIGLRISSGIAGLLWALGGNLAAASGAINAGVVNNDRRMPVIAASKRRCGWTRLWFRRPVTIGSYAPFTGRRWRWSRPPLPPYGSLIRHGWDYIHDRLFRFTARSA